MQKEKIIHNKQYRRFIHELFNPDRICTVDIPHNCSAGQTDIVLCHNDISPRRGIGFKPCDIKDGFAGCFHANQLKSVKMAQELNFNEVSRLWEYKDIFHALLPDAEPQALIGIMHIEKNVDRWIASTHWYIKKEYRAGNLIFKRYPKVTNLLKEEGII